MKNDQILKLVTPSWLVNVLGLTLGVVTTAVMIFFAKFQSSALRFQIYDVQARSVAGKQQDIYSNLTTSTGHSSFLGSLPLLITWACIGLLVYYFAVTVVKAFGNVASMRERMDYVHASRQAMLREAFTSLAIRLVATAGWFVFIKLSIAVLVPYALASATAAATGLSLQSVAYGLLAIVVLYVDVLVQAIFLRLVLLKVRVFGD